MANVQSSRIDERTGVDRRGVVLVRLLVAMIGWLVVMQAAVERSLFPPIGLIQAAFLTIPTILLIKRWRHAAPLSCVFAAVMVLFAVPYAVKDLGQPGEIASFGWTVVATPLLLAVLVAAIRAVRAGVSR